MGAGREGDDDEWVEEEEEIEEYEEEEEEEESRGARGGEKGRSQFDIDSELEDWKTLRQMPQATQSAFQEAFWKVAQSERDELTVLLLGKNGVGKSSTLNQVIGERKQKVNPYGVSSVDKPTIISRELNGFTLTLIDTPGLVVGDRVHEGTLAAVADLLLDRSVDVVWYVDRLDAYEVSSLDRAIFSALTRALGADVWANAMFVLTRGEFQPPQQYTWEDFASRRTEELRAEVRRHSGSEAPLPCCIAENSSKCARNWSSEKVLPNQLVWLPDLIKQTVDQAMATSPFEFSPRGKSPDSKWKWAVPLAFAAQLLLKHFVFDPVVKGWDSKQGDEWGPKQGEYKDEKYMNKIKEAKREYLRRKKEKQAQQG